MFAFEHHFESVGPFNRGFFVSSSLLRLLDRHLDTTRPHPPGRWFSPSSDLNPAISILFILLLFPRQWITGSLISNGSRYPSKIPVGYLPPPFPFSFQPHARYLTPNTSILSSASSIFRLADFIVASDLYFSRCAAKRFSKHFHGTR